MAAHSTAEDTRSARFERGHLLKTHPPGINCPAMRALPLLALLFLAACKPPLTVMIHHEKTFLHYDCARFEPKAKTFEEMQAVRIFAVDSILRARNEGDQVLARSLKAAREMKDIRRLEELLVQDECARMKPK